MLDAAARTTSSRSRPVSATCSCRLRAGNPANENVYISPQQAHQSRMLALDDAALARLVRGAREVPRRSRGRPVVGFVNKRREPQCPSPRPLRLCEPNHTVAACPGLHFHLLATDLDSEGGSSWETAISPPRRGRTPARQRAKAQSAERTSFTFRYARGAQ